MSASVLARHVVRELLDQDVRHAVLSPGSRSGPLALALLEAERDGLVTVHVRIDERTAAFLALGIAKASGRPAIMLTTSGTAVANLHPALLEAHHSRIPIVAVTADRPGSLRGTGANQTTNQLGIFGAIEFINVTGVVPIELPVNRPLQVNVELTEPLFERSGS